MYRVKDWDTVYENKESRKLKHARFVCVPNKWDGKGFRRLEQHPRKVELFCAWNLILQVASKCPSRGVLVDGDGPITPADLALKTNFPESIFTLAYEFFSSGGKLAWLDPIDGWSRGNLPAPSGEPGDAGRFGENLPDGDSAPNLHAPGESPGSSRDFPSEGKGREGKGIEEEKKENAGARADGMTPKAEFWDFLCQQFDLIPTSQRDELRLYEQCREFRQKKATVDEIRRRTTRYQEMWPDMPCTVKAILNNWDTLVPKVSVPASRRSAALSDRMLS